MTFELSPKITYKSLQENRRFFYVIILFVAACITESPNYVPQLQVAIPTLVLFEVLILLMEKFKIVIFYNFKD